jgi:hypothetical protein
VAAKLTSGVHFLFFNLPKGAASSQRTDCGKHDRASDIKCAPYGQQKQQQIHTHITNKGSDTLLYKQIDNRNT